MSEIARVIIAIQYEQNENQITAVAHRYLKGVASLFDLQVHHSVLDAPIDVIENEDLVCHKHLVYTFSYPQSHDAVLLLLDGTVKYLQGLGCFFDVYFDKFPYKLKF